MKKYFLGFFLLTNIVTSQQCYAISPSTVAHTTVLLTTIAHATMFLNSFPKVRNNLHLLKRTHVGLYVITSLIVDAAAATHSYTKLKKAFHQKEHISIEG